MTDQQSYEQKLSAWERDQERQKVEFTITEKDIDADLRMLSPEDKPSSARLQSLGYVTASEAELSKYRTLPPIVKHSQSTGDMRAAQRLQQKHSASFRPKPAAPKSLQLHLGLAARTYDVAEFRQNFPDQFDRFFVDRTLSEPVSIPREKSFAHEEAQNNDETKLTCSQREADMLGLVFADILRSVVDDAAFHETCDKVQQEDVPYFCQFSTTPLPKDQSSSPPDLLAAASLTHCDSHTSPTQHIPESGGSPDAGRKPELDSVAVTQPDVGAGDVVNEETISSHFDNVASFHAAVEDDVRAVTSAQRLMLERRQDNVDKSKFELAQRLKKLPAFGNFAEQCMENTISNIIHEAFNKEFNITARPRLVALPPRPSSDNG